MVFKYNSEQQAIAARSRIAIVEGYPKNSNSQTLYYLGYKEINGSYYIDARNESLKNWYNSEKQLASEVCTQLPIDSPTNPLAIF